MQQLNFFPSITPAINCVTPYLNSALNTMSGLSKWEIEDHEMFAKTILNNQSLCPFLKKLDNQEASIQENEIELLKAYLIRPIKISTLSLLFGSSIGFYAGLTVAFTITGGTLPIICGVISGLSVGIFSFVKLQDNKYSTIELYYLRAIRMNDKVRHITAEILQSTDENHIVQMKTVRGNYIRKVRWFVDLCDTPVTWKSDRNEIQYDRTRVLYYDQHNIPFSYTRENSKFVKVGEYTEVLTFPRPAGLEEENLVKL